jgi:hypothetical protein
LPRDAVELSLVVRLGERSALEVAKEVDRDLSEWRELGRAGELLANLSQQRKTRMLFADHTVEE